MDLEGKYVVFAYGEQGQVDEGWALAIYFFESGKLKPAFLPRSMDLGGIGTPEIEEAIDFLKRRGIEEVVTPCWTGDFHGIPSTWRAFAGQEDKEEVDEWWEYQTVRDWLNAEECYYALHDAGIRIRELRVENTSE